MSVYIYTLLYNINKWHGQTTFKPFFGKLNIFTKTALAIMINISFFIIIVKILTVQLLMHCFQTLCLNVWAAEEEVSLKAPYDAGLTFVVMFTRALPPLASVLSANLCLFLDSFHGHILVLSIIKTRHDGLLPCAARALHACCYLWFRLIPVSSYAVFSLMA